MKKKVISGILVISIVAAMVSGCGTKDSKSTAVKGTENTVASTEKETSAATVPAHKVGETYTQNINGTDVSFTVMSFDRAGVVAPIPSTLFDVTRYRGGVASEDDWNNYIICEPSMAGYQYYDGKGFFLSFAGYIVGDKNSIYTNSNGKSNITDSVTLSDAQTKWKGSSDAFSFTSEPSITKYDTKTLSVSFDTPLTKSATISGKAYSHTWQGEYYALKNQKSELNFILGNATMDQATVKAIGDYMVSQMTFEDKAQVSAGNDDSKSNVTTLHANGGDVSLNYTDADGLSFLTDNKYFTFDYKKDLMESKTQGLYRNDRAFLYTRTGISGISNEALATITDMNSAKSIFGQLGLYNYAGDNFKKTTVGSYTYMTFEGPFSVDGINYQARYEVMTNTISSYVFVLGFKSDGGDLTELRNTISDSCRIKTSK